VGLDHHIKANQCESKVSLLQTANVETYNRILFTVTPLVAPRSSGGRFIEPPEPSVSTPLATQGALIFKFKLFIVIDAAWFWSKFFPGNLTFSRLRYFIVYLLFYLFVFLLFLCDKRKPLIFVS